MKVLLVKQISESKGITSSPLLPDKSGKVNKQEKHNYIL